MKSTFLLAAFGLCAVTAASAQTTPTGTQRGGVVNQTTVPPVNPANPATNPGTIDQRTPTTTSPTQTGVMGTIDQTPATLPQSATTPAQAPAAPTRVAPGTMRRGAVRERVTRPAGRTATPLPTPRP